MPPLWVALSMCLPVVAGWLVVRKLWPGAGAALCWGLGIALGGAIAGTAYFLGLLIFDSSSYAFWAGELALGAVIVVAGRRAPVFKKLFQQSDAAWPYSAALMALISAALPGIAALLFAFDGSRHGGWDAFVMWNLRARMIAGSHTAPLAALFDPAFLGLHPDYPLLLPSLVARGWQYAGDGIAIPIALAALFMTATLMIVIGGLRVVGTRSQSCIAGCILLSTPFWLGLGALQYADIVLCCFMTAAVVLCSVYDSDPALASLPLLAGVFAAAAACTKNEGILFVVVLVIVRIAASGFRRELFLFGGGASFGLITLAVFKLLLGRPNDTLQLISLHSGLSRITDAGLNREMLSGFRDALNFGQWKLNPVPLMAAHAAVAWTPHERGKRSPWFTAAFVIIGMLCGYYVVYLLSPYDLESHLRSSLDRLLLQLWPSMIVLYSTVAAPAESAREYPRRSMARVTLVAAVAAMVFWWPSAQRRPSLTEKSTPHIEVSDRTVTTGQTYSIKVTGVIGPQVFISYSIDGKPMGNFGAYLGKDGAVDFQVSTTTPKGTYRFLAIRSESNPTWTDFDNVAGIEVQ